MGEPRGGDAIAAGRLGDGILRGSVTASAWLITAIFVGVTAFLSMRAWPALTTPEYRIRTVGTGEMVSLLAAIAPQIFGTLLGSLIALVLAVPLSVGVALFITHYAPTRMAAPLGYLIDLLAAVPSVIYGLWGAMWLTPRMVPLYQWFADRIAPLGLMPVSVSATGRTMASVSIVLAIMIVPIITAVAREVFAQTPRLNEEAAIALGATKWEVMRMAVLPLGRSGIVSASMLGLGRALGETMAVVMILSVGSSFSWDIFSAGQHSTIASNIALQFPESTGLDSSALMCAGLALFAITLVVNMVARTIAARHVSRLGKRAA